MAFCHLKNFSRSRNLSDRTYFSNHSTYSQGDALMGASIHFKGNEEISTLMNKLVDGLPLSLFGYFNGKNIAPVFQELISDFPTLGESSPRSESGPFFVKVPGGMCVWAPLAKSESTGGFLFCPLPDNTAEPGREFVHFNLKLCDILKTHCDNVVMRDRGNIEDFGAGMMALQMVLIPATTILSVF